MYASEVWVDFVGRGGGRLWSMMCRRMFRNGRPLHEGILGDHHVMTLVIIDGKTQLITVYRHLFQQPLQVRF